MNLACARRNGPRAGALLVVLVCLAVLTGGCAGPGPRLAPVSPVQTEQAAAGRLNWYDMDRNGKPDYAERIVDGRVVELHFISPNPGHEEILSLASVPESEKRDLVIILDSIPFSLVDEAWHEGKLAWFARPTRIIAPFPVMTDVSLVDLFHLDPGIAIESDYYDGKRETDGYNIYLKAGVAIWHSKVDYALDHMAHSVAYLDQLPWFDHELRQIQDDFFKSRDKVFVGYSVGTSALGALQGREGHEKALAQMDRFCREMEYRTKGRVRITLLSDHGHNLVTSTRIPIVDLLAKAGYRPSTRLKGPRDFILPEFAMATCSAIYTLCPEPIAQDAVKIDGIELAAYPDSPDSVTVLNRDGRARIERSDAGYRYEPQTADPLQLASIWKQLQQAGKIDPDGFVPDRVLAEATQDHVYPDAVDRLWRAFHEQFQHPPDVLLSVVDGKHTGSKFQSDVITLRAAHGNLRRLSTFGFVATSAGELPPTLRMRDLAPALRTLGVNVLN